ncbi:MAG: hypothetical protein ACREJC_03270 [Tepidisphaeraceae bacterium]
MIPRIQTFVLAICLLVFPGYALAQAAAPTPPPAWPRNYQQNGNTLTVYPPQVDSWKDYTTINFRCALALTPVIDGKTQYGVMSAQAETFVDENNRTVLITNLQPTINFPGMPDAQATAMKAMVKGMLPNNSLIDISLDQVLAYMHKQTKVPQVELNYNPPPIYYSDTPAILVIYMGQPQFKPIQGTDLLFAVNTNWVVLMDTKSSQYYLLDGNSWLTAPDPMKGPWTVATSLPDSLTKLPSTGNWESVKKHVPGVQLAKAPKVVTSEQPAELIVTSGPPSYTPIAGTRLMYIANPTMPFFWDLVDNNYYFLASGRWFRAPGLNGPWSAASTDLPAEFAKIPPTCPVGFVLASVPHTQEAQDAILLASVPHKSTINIATAKVDVTYDGTPKFVAIEGTPMTYAVNTPNSVLYANNQYYCCYQAVWFQAPAPTGPWVVCTSVPAVIYTMPPTCPIYNCTYVQVYGYTPTTVVVGYTAGYSGEYVAATGALMFGAGMITGALIASNNCYHPYYPCYYSYGCAAHYSYGYGCYYRTGGAYYGPHGGCGWGATYNPSTGTYARGGEAYGPDGAHWGAQAYNPWTNTYAQHTGGTNGYKSWGSSYVQQGDNWAQAGHESTARGSAGYAENSSGQWAEGAHSNVTNSSVAKTSSGNVYAGHDGNVYKNTGDGWEKYQGDGNWSDTGRSQAQSDAQSHSQNMSGLNQDAYARNQGSSNAASSWQSRSGSGAGGGGDHSWGGGGGGGGGDHSWGGGGGWGGRSGGGGGFHGGGGFRR